MAKKILPDIPPEKHLDFKIIGEDIDNLVETFVNKIDREFPQDKITDGKEIFFLFMKITKNLYRSIRYTAKDKHKDYTLKDEYVVSVIPIIRMLLDLLCSLIYISDNPNDKIERYYKAGWREVKERFIKYFNKYSGNNDWDKWLKEKSLLIDKLKSEIGITPAEENNLKSIPIWYYPGQMIKDSNLPKDLSDFLEYLNDWFYKKYSQATHLTWPGMSMMGGFFLIEDDEIKKDNLAMIRSDLMFDTIAILLAIISELECILNFGEKSRISYFWGIIIKYSDGIKELYLERYEKMLSV